MGPISTYGQVAAWLRERIADGAYGPGDRLPVHAELAQELGVSRQTVLSAVRELANEGLVTTDGRRGTWVRERVVFATDITTFDDLEVPRDTTHDAFMHSVKQAGRAADKNFSMRIEPAPTPVAVRLDINPKDLVVVRSVLEFVDDEPWIRATSYYPLDIAQETGLTTPDDIEGGTVRHLAAQGWIENAVYDETSTRPPDPEEARELHMAPGTPLLIWVRTAVTKPPQQRVTRVSVHLMAGDRNAVHHAQGDDGGRLFIDEIRARHGVTAW